MKLRRAMYFSVGANIVVPLAGLFSAPILTHTLGVVGRGEVAAATAPNALLVVAATLGFPEALTYVVARGNTSIRQSLRISAIAGVAFSLPAVLVCLLLAEPLTGGDADLAQLLGLATLLTVPTLVVNLLRGVAAGEQMWGLVAAEKGFCAVVRLIAFGALALGGELTVVSAVLVISVSPLAGAAFYLHVVLRPDQRARLRPGQVFRELTAYGFKSWIGSITSMVNGRLPQLLITPLAGTRQLGLFVVAILVADVLTILASGIRDVLFSANARSNDASQLSRASRVTVLLIAFLAVGVGVLLPYVLVPVFGAGFGDALATTYVLLAAAVLGIPGLILGAGLAAWNRPELGAYAALAALAVSTAGLVVLTPSGGAVGAAAAILVSSAVSSAVAAVFFSRITGLSVAAIVPPRVSDARVLASEAAGIWRRVRPGARR
jgi:O-antigen/teichoic acid export membrane protein